MAGSTNHAPIMSELSLQLTTDELAKLEKEEKIIANGIRTFHDVGSALLVIRDEKLHRAKHKTFDEYCKEKWGFERAYAYRLIDSSKVVANIKGSTFTKAIGDRMPPLPTTERQTRALKAAPAEKQAEIWNQVVEQAGDSEPDASAIEKIVKKLTPKKEPAASGWTKEALKQDAELAAAFATIEKVFGKNTIQIQRGAIESMKRSDVILLSKLPPKKMEEIQNLIMGNHWSTKRALEFINDMPTPTSTLEDMANWCLATKGLYFTATIEGFEHSVRALRGHNRG